MSRPLRSIAAAAAALALGVATVAIAQDPGTPPAPTTAPTTAPSPVAKAPPIPTDVTPTPPPTQRNYVALVVGIATYANLPKEVHLDFARSDAATVAQALREKAHFDQVFMLRDSEATKEAIRDMLRTKVAQFVGPNDVFILYFAGHGVGADLDTPVLLAYDSSVANGQEDGLELTAFARDIQTFAPAGTSLIVTDAIHRNQIDGIYFYGPAAEQWPKMPGGTMLLSSTGASMPAKDGAFAQVFATAIGGGADANGDHQITALELYKALDSGFQGSGMVPNAAGQFDWNAVVAKDVAGGPVTYVTEGAQKAPEPVFPDIDISAAKFVWAEGASQLVQCHDKPIVACAPSCYVRTFKAGICEVSAVMDGVQMTGKVAIVAPGKYDCMRKGGDITCTGPAQQ